jgi:hypothetical protein
MTGGSWKDLFVKCCKYYFSVNVLKAMRRKLNTHLGMYVGYGKLSVLGDVLNRAYIVFNVFDNSNDSSQTRRDSTEDFCDLGSLDISKLQNYSADEIVEDFVVRSRDSIFGSQFSSAVSWCELGNRDTPVCHKQVQKRYFRNR